MKDEYIILPNFYSTAITVEEKIIKLPKNWIRGWILSGLFSSICHEYMFYKTSRKEDLELFFGPIEPKLAPKEVWIEIQPHWIMANIMKETGAYESANVARRVGWSMPIPIGFETFFDRRTGLSIFTFVEKE